MDVWGPYILKVENVVIPSAIKELLQAQPLTLLNTTSLGVGLGNHPRVELPNGNQEAVLYVYSQSETACEERSKYKFVQDTCTWMMKRKLVGNLFCWSLLEMVTITITAIGEHVFKV